MPTNQMVNFTLPSPYQSEVEELERSRKLAEMLQEQSYQPIEVGSYKGIQAPISPLSGLAKMLKAYTAGAMAKDVADQRKALAERDQADQTADMGRFVDLIAGAPAVPARLEEDVAGNMWMADAIPARPAGRIDPSMIRQLKTPQMQQVALGMWQKQLEPKPNITVAPGATVFNPNTGETVFKAPDKKEYATTPTYEIIDGKKYAVYASKSGGTPILREADPAVPEKGKWVSYPDRGIQVNTETGEARPITLDGKPLGQKTENKEDGKWVSYPDRGIQVNKETGEARPITLDGKPLGQKEKPLTESQAKASVFWRQMTSATSELSKIPGYNPNSIVTQAQTGIAGGLANFIASPSAQRAKQVQNVWSEAYLRFKTGAASTPKEVELNVRTFFPQVGDSAEVVKQKARARLQAEKDISIAAGNSSIDLGTGPQVGEVDGGYRFKGGNPADRNNWEKVR